MTPGSEEPRADGPAREPFHAWDHRGVIAGVFLGLLVVVFLVVLAAAGDQGALAILVVVFAGILLIYLMGQMRSSGTRR